MTIDTKAFADVHERLREKTAELGAAAERLQSLDASERDATCDEIERWLRTDVMPHMLLDDWLLYPEAASRFGDPLIGVSLSYDHVAIRWWISELEAADRSDVARLRELLYGLSALIRVHIWKENELLLSVIAGRTPLAA